ncbi:MAG: secretin N-terminal domain-containing protein [Gammaproteobacteria bacterium]|nr:secretin N-terminal domain-containing protein [Gammaproteobacteria bacterium]
MNKPSRLRLLAVSLIAAGLSSCLTPPMYDDIQKEQSAVDKNIKKHTPIDDKKQKAVINNCGLYVDTTPISLKPPPAWLSQHIEIKGRMLPLDFYMRDLLKGTNGLVLYQEPGLKDTLLSFNFKGTIKDALDYIAAQTNFAYDIHGRTVSWSRFMIKTFDISFMPGSTNYLLGQQQGGSGSQGASGGGSSGGGNSSSSTNMVITGATSVTNQYSNITGKLSVWDDIKNTLKTLLSPEGKATISESTTSITIQDRPGSVHAIEKYLNQLNKELSRQVLIKIQVIDFTSHKGFDYGVDWNLIAGSLGVQGITSTPVAISGFDNTNSPAVSWVLLPAAAVSAGEGGPPQPTKAFLNALNEQGKTTLVTQPSMVTLNNQVAEVYINTQTGYLAEVTTTVTGTSGTSQTALTPGIVNSGFIFDVLPKIQGDKVYLQITGNISTPPSFTKATSGGQTISTPTIDEKRINQRTLVPSGGTLVLTGYRQISSSTAKNSFAGTGILGGVGASQTSAEGILLITPTILDND